MVKSCSFHKADCFNNVFHKKTNSHIYFRCGGFVIYTKIQKYMEKNKFLVYNVEIYNK